MKRVKARFFCMAGALLCALLLACGSGPVPASVQPGAPVSAQSAPLPPPATAQSAGPADELDAAVRAASDYLNGSVPGGNKLVILNIKSDYPRLSEYVIDMLTGNVVDDRRFTVVDRANLALINEEMRFQMSGEVSDRSARSIGQKAGAHTIVSGSITAFGDQWRLSVRALDVESAAVQGQWSRNIPNGTTLAALAGGTPSPQAVSGVSGYGGTAGSGGGNAPPASAPDKPFAEGVLGGLWNGTLDYVEGGTSYRDVYGIRLFADGSCWMAVTAEDGAVQAAGGYWSSEDGALRVDCEFRNPAIPRLHRVNWLSLYAL
jgi:TolB-like protein